MRHSVGWEQPPRPIDVIPSFDATTDYGSKVRSVLYDFKHDDDLKNALTTGPNQGAPFALVGNVPIGAMSGTVVVAAYEDPAGFVNAKYPALSPSAKAGVVEGIQNLFHSQKFQDAITGAIAKRSKLGPLPQNDYSDPVVIYYYDNDRMKRVSYPRAAISTSSGMALDPANRYWWKNNGITTQQKNDDGSWGDESFDWNKDIAGNISDITAIIVAIVGVILVATGVGAAAGAAILAFSAALAAEANMLDAALTSGDMQKAALGFINAITKLVGVELPSGVLTQLGKPVLAAAAGVLAQLLPYFGASKGLGFADAYKAIQENLNQFGPVTDQSEAALSALAGPQASKVLDGGYAAATYADPHEIQGIIDLLPDQDQKTLFQLGATLGMLRKDQQSPNYHYAATNRYASRGPGPIFKGNAPANVSAVQQNKLTAKQDLLNYIETVLKPRYNL